MKRRKLKVEEMGVQYDKTKRVPAVRLKGRWLQAAGLQAGSYVSVTVIAPGVLELRICQSTLVRSEAEGQPEGSILFHTQVPNQQ